MGYEQISAERKQLQSIGEVPEWFTTLGYQLFKKKYALEGETVKGAFTRVANTLAAHYPFKEQAAKKFFDLMWSGKLAPSTPVLCNTGTTRGMPVSCSGGYTDDSISGFYQGYAEVAMLSKNGFGTSSYLGHIRPAGSPISTTEGVADGAVPVLDSYLDVVRKVSQGSNRRGAFAGYIEFSSPDFDDILAYVQKNPADSNLGVCVRDSDIDALQCKEPWALERFANLLYLRARTGKGYIFKPDVANKLAPEAIKQSGMKILGSNLCVAPETKILTKYGYVPIAELENETVEVWNGSEWSSTTVYKTGENQKLLSVTTDSGYEVECTPYHKFYIADGYTGRFIEKRAHELAPGDKLVKFSLPVIDGDEELDKAYLNGFFSGDGCYYKGKNIVYLYGDKRVLSEAFLKYPHTYHTVQEAQDREVFHMTGLKEKFFVPDSSYTIKSKLEWLAGYLDADGSVYRNGTNEALVASSVEKTFLQEIQIMLQTMGVSAKVTKMLNAGIRLLPANDGTGTNKEFMCKDAFRLLITSYDTFKLLDMGLTLKRLRITKRRPARDAKRFVTIASVRDEGRIDDTYCFTEPKRHAGMFNGMLLGNCNEIALPSDKDHTFTCVLSSLNLTHWDSITDEDIRWSIVFLDCVTSEFLAKAKNIPELAKAVRFTEGFRALGLGALGYATMLQEKGIAFESLEAHMLNNSIFKRIRDQANIATSELAQLLGEPSYCAGLGVRNATLMAIAPNLSSAMLAGSVSQGIEPIVANAFIQQTAGGEFIRYNPTLMALMKDRVPDVMEELKNIATYHSGSVQHVDWLSDDEKLVFRTAYEIDQHAIIRKASTRQQHIDQGQSVNLFFSAEEDERVVAEVHKEALLDHNIKGLYYLRSTRGVKPSSGVCIACEG